MGGGGGVGGCGCVAPPTLSSLGQLMLSYQRASKTVVKTVLGSEMAATEHAAFSLIGLFLWKIRGVHKQSQTVKLEIITKSKCCRSYCNMS